MRRPVKFARNADAERSQLYAFAMFEHGSTAGQAQDNRKAREPCRAHFESARMPAVNSAFST